MHQLECTIQSGSFPSRELVRQSLHRKKTWMLARPHAVSPKPEVRHQRSCLQHSQLLTVENTGTRSLRGGLCSHDQTSLLSLAFVSMWTLLLELRFLSVVTGWYVSTSAHLSPFFHIPASPRCLKNTPFLRQIECIYTHMHTYLQVLHKWKANTYRQLWKSFQLFFVCVG